MSRIGKVTRTTRETDISCSLCLDGGAQSIETGIGFFDHMLTALSFHAGWGLDLSCKGDLRVDGHHTVEDVGISLGKALAGALGDRRGIERFAHAYVPMDEALGFAAADMGGRAYMSVEAEFPQSTAGDFDSCLVAEFFRALAANANITLHLKAEGANTHHMAEALFKAAGRAMSSACRVTREDTASTKGVL